MAARDVGRSDAGRDSGGFSTDGSPVARKGGNPRGEPGVRFFGRRGQARGAAALFRLRTTVQVVQVRKIVTSKLGVEKKRKFRISSSHGLLPGSAPRNAWARSAAFTTSAVSAVSRNSAGSARA